MSERLTEEETSLGRLRTLAGCALAGGMLFGAAGLTQWVGILCGLAVGVALVFD